MENKVNFVFGEPDENGNIEFVFDDDEAVNSTESSLDDAEKSIEDMDADEALEALSKSTRVDFVLEPEEDEDDEISQQSEADQSKHWMFMENVRLVHERQELDDERQKFEREKREFERIKRIKEDEFRVKEDQLERKKNLFDKQWSVVEKELHRIASDKERIKKEKAYIEREKAELRTVKKKSHEVTNGAFFVGVNSENSLKRRYRELMKIYHPDSGNGDEATMRFINKEYESLKNIFTE